MIQSSAKQSLPGLARCQMRGIRRAPSYDKRGYCGLKRSADQVSLIDTEATACSPLACPSS